MSTTTYLATIPSHKLVGIRSWQDTTSKSLYYQQRLTHYSWTLLVIILGCETIRSLESLISIGIPVVVINVERYSDAEVLSVLAQRIKQLNISKKDRTFKIHIFVMTKDDAAAVGELYQLRVYHV